MFQTQIKPSSQLRNNFPEVVKLVEQRDPVVITTNGKAQAVLINPEDYAEFEKYMHRQYVKEQLAEAEREAADPNVEWLSEEDVWAHLEEKYGI